MRRYKTAELLRTCKLLKIFTTGRQTSIELDEILPKSLVYDRVVGHILCSTLGDFTAKLLCCDKSIDNQRFYLNIAQMKHMTDLTQESMCSFIGMCSRIGSLQTSVGSRVIHTAYSHITRFIPKFPQISFCVSGMEFRCK